MRIEIDRLGLGLPGYVRQSATGGEAVLMTSRSWGEMLTADLCANFVVRQDGPDSWTVSSPFLFDDGDVLPVFIMKDEDDCWSLTDRGMAVSHLFFDEFQFTEARFDLISRLVSARAAVLGDSHEISMQLSGEPTPFELATFVQLLAQVQGVALTSRSDRYQSRYVTTLRTAVEKRLVTADFDENWLPPELKDKTKANYRADLRVVSAQGADVVLFAASTSDKANVSALTMGRFKQLARSDRAWAPLLAYHPERVSQEAVNRFQDEVDQDEVAIPVEPGNHLALMRPLCERGVALHDD